MTRTVTTRRIDFDRHEIAERHFVDDDLLFSNILAVLSAMFPHGEEFFVRTVRRYRDEIDNLELKRQIAGFIGQEMEHVTAVAGEHLLTDPAFEHQQIDDELRDMLRWHALEECEHKAVAFDTMRAVDSSEATRLAGMALTLAILGPFLAGALVRSIASDPATRNPLRLLRSVRRLPANPFARRAILRRLAGYMRPGFHPDDHDTAAVVKRWRAELFGTDGNLAGRISTRASA